MSYKHPTATELGIACSANERKDAAFIFMRRYRRTPTLDDKDSLIQCLLDQRKAEKRAQERIRAMVKNCKGPYIDYSDQAVNNVADDF